CPCFGSLFPPLAALTFAASSIICAFGLASAAPRSPYRHLELCGIASGICKITNRGKDFESCWIFVLCVSTPMRSRRTLKRSFRMPSCRW
ncbi:MAG: hypothetical protein PUF35_00635, partial [Subdoligranulum sp.]|nr:hypothetical protein [Subdoligranulum sp.]